MTIHSFRYENQVTPLKYSELILELHPQAMINIGDWCFRNILLSICDGCLDGCISGLKIEHPFFVRPFMYIFIHS